MSTEKVQPILEGYLKKQSPKGLLVKPWQERYFVLQPNGEILYYASHQSMSDVTGRIKLRTITEIGVSKKNGCLIEIQALKKGSPRSYLLLANNSSDARMWLDNIEDVRKKCEEADKKGSETPKNKMSLIFQCPDGVTFIERPVSATENMYEVKAGFFAHAKRMGRPLPGVSEDYLVILETADLEPQQIFLEDIRGELGQHPSFATAFAEKQSWKAVVKPLAEMSELKQQLERQRSTSQEIEILVGRSASVSSADSVYLSEVIRSRSRSSSQDKGTWTLPLAETGPYKWGPESIELSCSYPRTAGSALYNMTFTVPSKDTVIAFRDMACRAHWAASAKLGSSQDASSFALKLGGLNVYADTRNGSRALVGDYKIIQHAASAKEPGIVGLVKIPSILEDEEANSGEPAVAPDPIQPSFLIPWTEWQAIPSSLLKLQFKLKVGEVLVSGAESQLRKLGIQNFTGGMFITAGLFYGGETLTNECLLQTSLTYSCATPRWNEWLTFPLSIGSLPQATRLCFSLFYREAGSSSSAKDTPLGWVNLQLMDHKGMLVAGKKKLRLWPDGPANAIGTCMDNTGTDSPGAMYVQFDESPLPSIFSQESARVAPEPFEVPAIEGRKASGSVFGLSPFASAQAEPALRAEESLRLQDAIRADVLTLPTDEERRLLWKARNSLKSNVRALYKVIHSVPWTNRKAIFEARQLLTEWAVPAPLAALQLLNAQFADPEVRKYAVSRLRELDDSQLQNYVLQLVQVLKYEAYHNSEVAQFLLERAVGNRTIGHQFFWHLQAELHVPTIKDRYSLILAAYLRCCGSSIRKEFLKQCELVKKLCAVADAIKAVKGESERMALIRKMLAEIRFPDKVMLPLDPRFEVSGLIVEKCKFMDSKKLPLWLVFQNADPQGAPIYVIFKSGDDLRQDMLTLQMIRIMDKLWQQNELDLGLNAYSCMATGDEMGMLQVVLNAETTSAISKAAGGSSACFREDPIANWLKQHNPTPEKNAKAVENFTRSCAGYCVATCVLGIGDRHNDNIMLQRTGYLFHIDFGHFLGNFKSKFGFRRERAKFVFTPDFAYVMGGVGGERFKRFEQLCAQAFNVLRKEADLFINLFALMLSSGIPELQSPEDIHYLRDSFLLDLSDEDAGKEFIKWIHESLNTRSTQLNNAIHTWAHS